MIYRSEQDCLWAAVQNTNALLPMQIAPPEQINTLFCCAVPYYTEYSDGNISIYARGADYHRVLRDIMGSEIERLKCEHEGAFFTPLVDVSPFDEVRIAAMAGLGRVGAHGLLITEAWGSYVFLGIIASSAPTAAQPLAIEGCISCGVCKDECPVSLDKTRCLSHLTQKRGELSESELRLIASHPLIWGCDICQMCCPMNMTARRSTLAQFTQRLTYSLSSDDLPVSDRQFRKKYADKAFSWRGLSPLKRNLVIKEKKV